ncbi:MAG: hypothetical protein WA280_13015, partial [Xanthobacteraceae bacterium]
MPGLVPGIYVFLSSQKSWMAGTWASEATPFFERLCPGMTAAVEFRDEELLADVICRLIGDVRHVAVGSA